MPLRKVAILPAQLGHPGRTPIAAGTIELAQFLGEDAHRPPVRDDVMEGHQENMVFFVQLQQTYPHQVPLGQIEGEFRFGRCNPQYVGSLFRADDMAQIG